MRLPQQARLLDVGCGNNSPYYVKSLRPDVYYVGLDIGDYHHHNDPAIFADEYITIDAENFHIPILERSSIFDAVVCAHNLEHCNDWRLVTRAICGSLKKGGSVFFSFPCEASVNFPSRRATLNFFDDPSHKRPIPYDEFCSLLKSCGVVITYAKRRYRPLLLAFIGFLLEPISRLRGVAAPLRATWALYGFETVIQAKKIVQ